MKRFIIYISVAMAAGLSSCYYIGPCIDGSGVVISEERTIEDFSGVANTTSFNVHVQQADTFSVVVEAQENLLSVIETYVSGNTLIVDIADFTCIRSTSAVDVYVSLPLVEDLSLTGSGTLDAATLEADYMDVSLTGSGTISIDTLLYDEVRIRHTSSGDIFIEYVEAPVGTVSLSGSGEMEIPVFDAAVMDITQTSSGDIRMGIPDAIEVEGVLTGSGRITLEGTTELADFTLSSSGRIDAYDLTALDVSATASGSGDIYVYAVDNLDVSILGSGDVYYGGNPVVNSRLTGSGDLRQID